MEGSDFVFDGIVEMCYKCHRISLNRVRSYVDSSDWMKKATINLTVCFYHATYAFQSECTLYSCLIVKKILTQNRPDI